MENRLPSAGALCLALALIGVGGIFGCTSRIDVPQPQTNAGQSTPPSRGSSRGLYLEI